MIEEYEVLKLENQLCFPLNAASRKVVNLYRLFLSDIGLTYTQYITMMVIWENGSINARELGKRLHLDSGTLTPVLKSLESQGYITRQRSTGDERVLVVSVTDRGLELREDAIDVPGKVANCLNLDPEEAIALHRTLYKILDNE